jgi:hypothetical protein
MRMRMARMHAPLDPECPQVADFMTALFDDPMTEAMGAPTDDICEMSALPRIRRGQYRD